MSHNLKLASILAANQLVQDDPWILLLQIELDPLNNPGDIVYLANNRDDYVWNGQTYLAFSFELDVVKTTSSGELTQVQLSVSNVNGAIQAELEEHGGGVDSIVTLSAVNNGAPVGEPELVLTWTIQSTQCDVQWAHFTLGAPNPLRRGYPGQIYMADFCRHMFNTPAMQAVADPRGRHCDYFGNLTSCSHLKDGSNGCIAHNNLLNFGGQPTIMTTGFAHAVAG